MKKPSNILFIIVCLLFIVFAILNAVVFIEERNYQAAIGWGVAMAWCFIVTSSEIIKAIKK